MKQNVGLALESDVVGASKFPGDTNAVLRHMVCISGEKGPWSRGGRLLGSQAPPSSRRCLDGVKTHSGPGPSSFGLSS